jgi:SPP1 gp7 family putative phage head morphogenesis protein
MPPSETIPEAYATMKRSFIEALTNNAAEALLAGEVRASNLLRIPLNFNLINSRAVTATRAYREDMIRFGGSQVTKMVNGVPTRTFEPWLNDLVEREQEQVATIIQESIKSGSSIRDTEKALQEVFTQGEHNARLTAYQETKALYNRGTMERFNHENVQRGIWHHSDPQENPREEHQELDGKEFDLDDPIWNELEFYNCKCWCEPVIIFRGD